MFVSLKMGERIKVNTKIWSKVLVKFLLYVKKYDDVFVKKEKRGFYKLELREIILLSLSIPKYVQDVFFFNSMAPGSLKIAHC